ncbi:MAG: retroviral-like aspartic protease family protein, partial [Bacteroidota bacterium]
MEREAIFAKTTLFDEIMLEILTPAGISDIQPDAQPHWVQALWDTGATMSCISDRLAKQLGLTELGFMQMGTGSGFQRVP